MNTLSKTGALLLLVTSSALPQGTFQNLDFESATLVPIPGDPYGRVQFAQALPGWNGYTGTHAENGAMYNNGFLDSSGIAILDHNVPTNIGLSGVIEGNFTVLLMAGVWLYSPTAVLANTTLSQTGLIPADAQSIRYKISGWLSGGDFMISIGGQRITSFQILEMGRTII